MLFSAQFSHLWNMNKNHTIFCDMVKLKNACIVKMMKIKYSTQDVDTKMR